MIYSQFSGDFQLATSIPSTNDNEFGHHSIKYEKITTSSLKKKIRSTFFLIHKLLPFLLYVDKFLWYGIFCSFLLSSIECLHICFDIMLIVVMDDNRFLNANRTKQSIISIAVFEYSIIFLNLILLFLCVYNLHSFCF